MSARQLLLSSMDTWHPVPFPTLLLLLFTPMSQVRNTNRSTQLFNNVYLYTVKIIITILYYNITVSQVMGNNLPV